MSYPSGPPGSPGYPSGLQTTQYSAPTQQFGHVQEPIPSGPSKLPHYLNIAVVVLGLAGYVTTFALGTGTTIGPMTVILAGLLAGVGLVPKQKGHLGVVAVLAVLGLLLAISDAVTIGASSLGWAWYLLIAVTVLQAASAVAALLLDAGVITAPVPKPRYEPHLQNPYAQYGAPGPYYGPPQGQQQGPPHQQGPPPQRGGYPPQYGGYPNGPSSGGFNTQPTQPGAPPQQSGPPTPPTGFPAFGQPQEALASQPTQTFETQQPEQQAASQSAPPPS